ncbi:hypothetical protein [Brevundimonas sp.]|uniref:hypothetical protein n=1 Tax=Brevundimonas sp. TaxID=1871086 RepID=UPI0028A8278D|nr:hypothetical protein [Brevundimonas sp.]
MNAYTLSMVTAGVRVEIAPFEAPGSADALWFSRGFVCALSELRPDLEIGTRYRLDRVLIRNNQQITDDSTFEAECDVVEQDGRIGAIWRVPAPPPDTSWQ